MSVFYDTSSNFHPYECDGPGKCVHCDREVSDRHDPQLCALCDDDEGRPDVTWKVEPTTFTHKVWPDGTFEELA